MNFRSLSFILPFGLIIFIPLKLISQDFSRQTSEAGLHLSLIAGSGTNGVSVADYNQDGFPDIYFVVPAAFNPANKGTWNLLFAGNEDGTFSEIKKDIGVYGKGANITASYMGKKMGASWGDFDNDGYPDLYLTNTGPNQLLHNNGDGTFTDITESAGVAGGENQFSSSALWFDFDTDGDLDLYVSVWTDYSDSVAKNNHMYENLGSGNFQDISASSGLDDSGETWMSVAIDINKDGLPDLYLANDFGENSLYINNGDKTFSEKAALYGIADRFEGMGLAIGDVNSDGLFDIYLTNATEKPFNEEQTNPLFINSGDSLFQNKAVEASVPLAGWGWDTGFFDYDNDGSEDLFVVNGYQWSSSNNIEINRLFRNNSTEHELSFEMVSEEAGVADDAESRSFVVFDYNNDGYQDILISNFAEKPYLYRNELTNGNWLKVHLEGSETNRNGFGSVVEVEANGRLFRKYHHGAHFYGQNILPVHFGLGDAAHIDKVSIYWLNGHIDEISDIEVNQSIKVKEMEGLITSAETTTEKLFLQPDQVMLRGNYPNPFNGSTKVLFELNTTGKVTFEVFNIIGQRVYKSSEVFSDDGIKSMTWKPDLYNQHHSGLFLYRITYNNSSTVTGKMNYIK